MVVSDLPCGVKRQIGFVAIFIIDQSAALDNGVWSVKCGVVVTGCPFAAVQNQNSAAVQIVSRAVSIIADANPA